MENPLSNRVLNMKPSATIEMNAKSRALKEQGIDVISLSLGEPDFSTPEIIKEAAKAAIDNNFSKYPPIAGFSDLKKVISEKFKKENKLDYTSDEIVVSTGAKQSLANVILALINPGDEVLLPAPFWVSYVEQVKLAGGIPVMIPTDLSTDFKVSGKVLAKYITNKTKLLIYSSPCNPSGSLYSRAELDDIANELLKHDNIFVLADEIYEYINFTNEPHYSMAANPKIWDRTITVNGVAKGFAMTGYRIGYIGAPKWICDACSKIQGQFTSGANSIAQKATIEAMQQGKNLVQYMVEAFKKRRDLVYKELKSIPKLKVNLPPGAFYFFPDVSKYFGGIFDGNKINNDVELCLFLLNKGHIAVVPGSAFGDGNCIRISYATDETTLLEAMKRIKNTLSLLQFN